MDNLSQNLANVLEENLQNNDNLNLENVLQEYIRKEVERAVNSVLNCEFNTFIGYDKNEQGAAKELGNSRNGFYERDLKTTYGDIKIKVPRDRNAEFSTVLFEKHTRTTKNIPNLVLKLYKSGMTDYEIQEIIESLYSHKYSTSTISKIVDAVQADVDNFKKKPLKSDYFAIFMDSTYVPLRRDTVEKEAINIIMGIDMDGLPEVSAFSITPTESASEWDALLESLMERGLKNTRIVVSDGCTGLKDTIKKRLPAALYQRCFVHLIRNLASKVRSSDKYTISNEFASLAKHESYEKAKAAFEEFKMKRSAKYANVKEWLEKLDIESTFNFYRFPKELRGRIYTNNRIEAFNKEIKRQAKIHIQRSTQESEERFLVSLFLRYNLKTGKRAIHNKDMLDCELSSL